jgi:hypothetical protein
MERKKCRIKEVQDKLNKEEKGARILSMSGGFLAY